MDRRSFLSAIAAGAVVTASGLWIPGQKLISIPKKQTFFGFPHSYFSEGALEDMMIEIHRHSRGKIISLKPTKMIVDRWQYNYAVELGLAEPISTQ